MLSDVVAEEVGRLRREAGINRDQLAERCAGLNFELSASSIANIETGRRDKDGGRRREITVDELVALAAALEVPAVSLVFPVGHVAEVEALPGRQMNTWEGLRWFTGEAGGDPLRLFREHAQLVDELRAAHGSVASHRSAAAQWRDVDPERATRIEADAEATASSIRRTEALLHSLRRNLRGRVEHLPPLPAEYAHIDRTLED